jgi:hypothetical protein
MKSIWNDPAGYLHHVVEIDSGADISSVRMIGRICFAINIVMALRVLLCVMSGDPVWSSLVSIACSAGLPMLGYTSLRHINYVFQAVFIALIALNAISSYSILLFMVRAVVKKPLVVTLTKQLVRFHPTMSFWLHGSLVAAWAVLASIGTYLSTNFHLSRRNRESLP